MNRSWMRYLSAVLTLIGTVIGVGIFGVPYALAAVGLAPAIAYFVVLGGVQLLQHLFYAEAAIASPEPLRLVGLVERYVGRRMRHVAGVSIACGYWGAMLAYMIVGGTFLHVLLGPWLGGDPLAYQVAWALVGAAVVYFGLDFVTRLNVVATVGLLAVMAVLVGIGLPHVQLANFQPFVGHDLLLPYGVVLFSLSGLPAILEMEDILKGEHARYRSAVTVGTLAATALTAAFGFVVWGVSGAGTTHEAVAGLQTVMGGRVAAFAALFGFLAVVTSFFSTALNLQSTFQYDYKLPRVAAWLLTGGLPFALLLLGARDFVSVVSFSGAVFGGVSSIMVALLYIAVTKRKAMREKPLGMPLWVAYFSIALLAVGAVIVTGHAALDLLR